MHEIITLQLGQQSNYLATHFWNTQESYFTYSADQEPLIDHDVHWRPGVGADGGETYLPRTVVYDLKGEFGSLRKINALYEMQMEGEGRRSQHQGLWNGPAVVHEEHGIAPSAYQQSLAAGRPTAGLLTPAKVRYWSDFGRVYLHPRSVVQVHESEARCGNASSSSFDAWAAGQDLFASLDREHDLADRDVRPFVEEADNMQAIQVFAAFDDAWAAFAARYVERLRDEYAKTAIWVWGSHAPSSGVTKDRQLTRLANKALALSDTCRQASMVIPLALPQRLGRGVSLDASSLWHTTALAAAAVETATLPSRLRDHANRATLADMAHLLNRTGNQTLADLHMALSPDRGLPSDLDSHFAPSDHVQSAARPRQPEKCREPHVFGQLVTTRGFEHEHDDADAGLPGPHHTVTRRYRSPLGFPLLDSFPAIFFTDGGEAVPDPAGVTASLSTDSSVSDRLRLLRATVSRSIGIEDRENIGNDLAQLADEYNEGWSSGSDEGDDE